MISLSKQKLLSNFYLLFPLAKYKISGSSMSPTLSSGQIVLVNRLAYLFKNPQKGEIVAAKDPRDGKILLKRISRIEAGKYFLVGDNPAHSTDSRTFGMIGKREIIGKVVL